MVAGILPDVAHSFDVGTGGAGYAVTWCAAVVAVVAPAIGFSCSGVSRMMLVGVGMSLIAVGTGVIVVAPALGVFVLG